MRIRWNWPSSSQSLFLSLRMRKPERITSVALAQIVIFLYAMGANALVRNVMARKSIAQTTTTKAPTLHDILGDVIESRFKGCHLLVLRDRTDSLISPLLMTLEARNQPLVVVDPWMADSLNDSLKADILQDFLIGDKNLGCRAVIIYLPESPNSNSISFLRQARLFEQPYIKVLAMGLSGGEEDFLMDHALRNTIHALYFAFVLGTRQGSHLVSEHSLSNSEPYRGLQVYLRCLYCDGGNSQVILVDSWYRQSNWTYKRNIFPDQFKNFHGYKLRMVVKSFFPFAEYVRDSDEAGSTVTFVDCLEVRMLREMARTLNLTFEARLSIDDEWGQPVGGGKWTGLVGTLMREDGDFATCLFPSAKRRSVIDFTRMYAPEPFLLATLKPQPLPQYVAIIKPFTFFMWVAVVATGVAVGVSFWLLQKGWRGLFSLMRKMNLTSDYSPYERFSISESLFYTWGIMFQQTPFQHPTYNYGRLWVACWVIFSLLILVSYKSALIASLSVPQLSETVDSIPQLLDQRSWTWGMEPHYSVGWRWLTESDTLNNQKVAETLEVENMAEQMEKVAKGRHAFFTWKNYVKSFIAAEYTDKNGYTPIHISRQTYLETSGSYWGCRRGAPFLKTIINIKQHLFQASLLELWLNQIFANTARAARKKKGDMTYVQPGGKQIVLSLNHLQGAFYILFLGQGLALVTLILENIRSRSQPANC